MVIAGLKASCLPGRVQVSRRPGRSRLSERFSVKSSILSSILSCVPRGVAVRILHAPYTVGTCDPVAWNCARVATRAQVSLMLLPRCYDDEQLPVSKGGLRVGASATSLRKSKSAATSSCASFEFRCPQRRDGRSIPGWRPGRWTPRHAATTTSSGAGMSVRDDAARKRDPVVVVNGLSTDLASDHILIDRRRTDLMAESPEHTNYRNSCVSKRTYLVPRRVGLLPPEEDTYIPNEARSVSHKSTARQLKLTNEASS